MHTRYPPRRRLRYALEGAAAHIFVFSLRLMPLRLASAYGGWLGRLIGPRSKASRYATANLTTAFPEVRLKRYLEMRGADGGPWARLCALPALWAGLLYHQPSLDAAWEITRDWSMEERLKLRADVPRQGLQAKIHKRSVQSIALELIDLAAIGLGARRRLNSAGENETGFLSPLRNVAEGGVTPAERKLALYHGDWQGSVDPLFTECAY